MGKEYDCFALQDLVSVYRELFGRIISTPLFVHHFQEVSKLLPFSVVPCKNMGAANNSKYTLMYDAQARTMSKELAIDIQDRLIENGTGSKPPHTGNHPQRYYHATTDGSTAMYTLVNDTSSSDESDAIQAKANGVLFNNSFATEEGHDKGKASTRLGDLSSNSDSSTTSEISFAKNAETEKSTQDSKSGSIEQCNIKASDFDEDTSESVEFVNKFKSPFEVQNRAACSTPADIRNRIDEAYSKRPVIPIDSFHAVFCEVHGKAINIDTAPCPVPKHKHPTLSKYLRCYEDIVELRLVHKMYAINKTEGMKNICQRRLSSYSLKPINPLFKASLEALCVNIFSTKVTLFFGDFIELFKIVYWNSFESIFKCGSPQEYLCNLRSPNIILVKKNNLYTITLCPTHHSSFVEWLDPLFHRKIEEIEHDIVESGKAKAIFSPCAVSSLGFFERQGLSKECMHKVSDVLSIADLNVPRKVQKRSNFNISGVGFGDLWKYMCENVNFDDKRTYFA